MNPTHPDLAERAGTRFAEYLIGVACLAGIYFGATYWFAWTAPDTVRESIPVVAKCDPPTEPEQLHIVIVKRGEKFAAECMYVGSRGTYRQATK